MTDNGRYRSFREFYPYYLSEHRHPMCRGLHYVGSTIGLAILVLALATQSYVLILPALVVGYGFAWTGHFFFEHNKPATFQYPLWSFMGDWVMLKNFLSGKFRDSVTD